MIGFSAMNLLVPFAVLLLAGSVPVSARCPMGCECNDEILHVSCVDANLDIVPITLNPSIQRLNLRNNRIRALDTGFHFYHQLSAIDLSHNHLVKIAPGSFGQQARLTTLALNSNKIAHLSNLTFGTGLSSLAVLNLRENFLEAIEPATFSQVGGLEDLDLGQNQIRTLNTSSFEGLKSLRTLRIDRNELTRVPDVFSRIRGNGSVSSVAISEANVYLPHLTELFMGMNPIERLGNDAFRTVRNLGTLDLRGCKISTIEPFAFRGLGVLRKLILVDNELTAVPTLAFPPLTQLELLKLGRNPIAEFPSHAFQSLKVLKTLEMQGAAELQLVDKDAFAGNPNLDHFEISKGPKLALLPPKLFHQQNMQRLILKDNALTTLPEDLVNWRNLRALEVDGNPLNCVCDLLWLRDLLLERFANQSFVLCASPAELEEKKLIQVSNKDLNCYLNGPVEKTIVGISVALAIILLVVFFFLMYKYHDRIKNTCKRGFRRPARKNRNTVISSGKERVDAASTKTSFLSQPQFPFSDEEFAIRASLMSASPPTSASFLHSTHSMNPHHHHPHHNNSLRHGSSTLQHPHHPHHHSASSNNHNSSYGPPTYNDYDTPHVNLNMNYPHFPTLHNGGDPHLQLHYPHPGHPMVKPIPITEL